MAQGSESSVTLLGWAECSLWELERYSSPDSAMDKRMGIVLDWALVRMQNWVTRSEQGWALSWVMDSAEDWEPWWAPHWVTSSEPGSEPGLA